LLSIKMLVAFAAALSRIRLRRQRKVFMFRRRVSSEQADFSS
jgi:hypothetical protein